MFSLIFIYSCDGTKSKKTYKDTNDEYHLIDKQIKSIDSVLPKGSNGIIFLFNYYDCGSCVDSGFVITKKIDSIYPSQKVFIISTMGDPQYYQKRNRYNDYIYMDSKDLIRKELKYIQTPIILSLDSTNKIVDYIFPNVTSREKELLFINKITVH